MSHIQNDIAIVNRGFHDLNPIMCGEHKCAPGYFCGPTCRKYYLIHYVVSGFGTLITSNKTYPVSPGYAFLIRPYEINHYRADDISPWHYIWIGFNGSMCQLLDELSSPVFPINGGCFFDIASCQNRNNMREAYLAGRLFTIFSDLFEHYTSSPAEAAMNYLNSHYMRRISIENIANMLNFDRRYLSRVFKKHYNITMQDYLTEIRMKEAQRLLKASKPISLVAKLVGYDDLVHFSKQFKKYTSLSPKQYSMKKFY